MLRIRHARAIKVIQAERNLIESDLVKTRRYDAHTNTIKACKSPAHCAIGALLFAAGVSNKTLAKTANGVDAWTIDSEPSILLYQTYGLRRYHVQEIMASNDDTSNFAVNPKEGETEHDAVIRIRQHAVIRRITALARAQKDHPRRDRFECDSFDTADADNIDEMEVRLAKLFGPSIPLPLD